VVAGGLPGHDGGREWGERREEVGGDSFLSSPRARAACGERSTGGGGLQADAALVAAVGSSGEGGIEARGGVDRGARLYL
jgi:hypothetical protein